MIYESYYALNWAQTVMTLIGLYFGTCLWPFRASRWWIIPGAGTGSALREVSLFKIDVFICEQCVAERGWFLVRSVILGQWWSWVWRWWWAWRRRWCRGGAAGRRPRCLARAAPRTRTSCPAGRTARPRCQTASRAAATRSPPDPSSATLDLN